MMVAGQLHGPTNQGRFLVSDSPKKPLHESINWDLFHGVLSGRLSLRKKNHSHAPVLSQESIFRR